MKISEKDKLTEIDFVSNIGGYKLYLFTPTIFRLYPVSGNTHKMDLSQKIRFLQALKYGYRVYVLTDANDEVMVVLTMMTGGSKRYPFSTKNDLIAGPLYTMPEFRKKGLASLLIKEIIYNHESRYDNIYGHIWYTNHASVNCMDKLGFEIIGNCTITKFTHKLLPDKNGKLILVRKKKDKALNEKE